MKREEFKEKRLIYVPSHLFIMKMGSPVDRSGREEMGRVLVDHAVGKTGVCVRVCARACGGLKWVVFFSIAQR